MINTELIDKIVDQIQKEPKKFDMGFWQWGNMNECGSTACIAGWAAVLSGEKWSSEDRSLDLLGLSYDDRRLFFISQWPEHYREILISEGEHKAAILLLQDTALLGHVPHE